MIFRLLFIGFCLILASCTSEEEKLPVLGRGKIPAFSFYNQDSVLVTNKDFDNHIYVADFFFTSCPTICPVMHRNLLKVYEKFRENPQVKLLSHTIDYKYDRPSQLKAYAGKLGVDGNRWAFLWGPREDVYSIAQNSYMVSVNEDSEQPGGFVHQGYLILVDKEKRVRGAYDGTLETEVEKLMEDIDKLLKEYQ